MKINLNNKTLIKEIIMIMIKDINIKKKNSNFNQNKCTKQSMIMPRKFTII